MPNDEFNSTGTLEEGEFKPYTETQNKKVEENVHDQTTDQLLNESADPKPIRGGGKK